jgi:hypothetical protein
MADLKQPQEEKFAETSSAVGAELLASSLGDYVRIVGRRIRSGRAARCRSSSASW